MKKFIFFSSMFLLLHLTGHTQNNVSTQYFENGNKKSEGVLIGAATISPNDTKQERAEKLSNAVKDGKWFYWYDTGKLRSEEYFDRGSGTGIWRTWYPDGQLSCEINFEKSFAAYWFANGSKQSEGTLLKGKTREGKWNSWHDNGAKNCEGDYKNGQKDGVWLWWNEKGEKTFEEIYKEGTQISIKKY